MSAFFRIHLATTALSLGLALPAVAQVPAVVTDIAVTQSLVAQVMGEVGTPQALAGTGDDPHNIQLRPSQARALAGADLVVWMGAGLSPWVEAARGDGAMLDLSGIAGLHVQGFGPSALMGEAQEHDNHADGHGHEDAHGHEDEHVHGDGHDDEHDDEHGNDHAGEHDDHAHGDTDPHLWLDPANASTMIAAIAAELSRLDPENAASYAANADTARQAIAALDAELAAQLAPARNTGLVVYHDAYGYFASHYGLRLLGAIAEGDASDPGAQRLAAIRAHLTETGAACLFPETGHSDRYLTLVAEGSDLRLGAPLDPEGRGQEPGADLYGGLMRGLATAIADCAAQP